MSTTGHSRTGGDTGAIGRLATLAPPLAALLFPFALEGFHTSVAHIVALGASTLSWLSAAARLALAFAMPLIAMLAAMYLSEIGRPTAAQLRAKRTALLTVAAPTLFVFLGVVLNMLSNAVADTLPWVACWAIARREHQVVGDVEDQEDRDEGERRQGNADHARYVRDARSVRLKRS